MTPGRIAVGCAGWSLPRDAQDRFAPGDSHLARYASHFAVTEINSSFHRPHARKLYEKWASSVPAGFRFCAKLPKEVTHGQRLVASGALLDAFFEATQGLAGALAGVLVQLPPSFAFDATVLSRFLGELRERFSGFVACEPRHATWFTPQVDDLLAAERVARVLADPVRHPGGERPGGCRSMVYLRLHGTPRVYYSAYEESVLAPLAARLREAAAAGQEAWCIFDNTASGAAVRNALRLQELLGEASPPGAG